MTQLYCHDCPCLSITEVEQHRRNRKMPHECTALGNVQLLHWDKHPLIPRHKDCPRTLLGRKQSITNGIETIHHDAHEGWYVVSWDVDSSDAEFSTLPQVARYIRDDYWRPL